MKVVHQDQTRKHKYSDVCLSIEYPLGDPDINGDIVKLTGRYPGKGRIVNLKCKEMAYIIEGTGKLVVEGQEVKLGPGDLVLIEPQEKYFWEGNLTMFVPCTPAWSPKQHKEAK